MEFTKESLTKLIKESSNLEELASNLGISRRSLLRLREKHGIIHIPCIGGNKVGYKRSKNQKTTEVTFAVPSNIEEYNVTNLGDINTVLDLLIDQPQEEYKVGLFDLSNFSSEEEKLQEENDLKALCKQLGISIKELKKLQETEVEERVNPNLNTEYEGRFKEKSDITHKGYTKFVITSIQNDTQIDTQFYNALENYCELNKAKLLVVPVYYFENKFSKFAIDDSEIFFDNIQLTDNLKLYANLKISPTITDPFAGIDSLSKGDTIIVPHPQLAMRTLATLGDRKAQMWTTGSITLKDRAYKNTKTGIKAKFNHSNSALIVELSDGDSFHVRNLNCDENSGFFDISGYYTEDSFEPLTEVEAIYLGDTHVGVVDPNVVNATWRDKDSMAKLLKPKAFIHGDILDSSAQSHHDSHDYVLRAAKAQLGLNNVEDELIGVATFLRSSYIPGTKNIIVSSNHIDHFYKWMTTCDPKIDVNNAKLYHKMNYLMLEGAESCQIGVNLPNAFKLYYENSPYKDILEHCEFTSRTEGYRIMDIEVSMHGDKGANGSRGSAKGISGLSMKTIIGHSHTPRIEKGCFQVGTSSYLNLSYNSGPSSWMQAHCIIYSNGKRQMINIINGKWKA